MTAYYNEIDEHAAETLRNLIVADLIAPGIVDTRSIEDVTPGDLAGFTQCHFFAGIGVWSYALRLAGWPDDRSVWTGSCPCQPFSSAGKGAGFIDERHLWPAWHWLIDQCRPESILGEQVASKDADAWIDLVQTDLEALDYAVGAVAFPSAGVGAPHIRDRLYWVGQSDRAGRDSGRTAGATARYGGATITASGSSRLVDSDSSTGGQGRADFRRWLDGSPAQSRTGLGRVGVPGRLVDSDQPGSQGRRERRDGSGKRSVGSDGLADQQSPAGPTNGIWRNADWLFCRDGKWRPVESGAQQMVDGVARGVGLLCAGNVEEEEVANESKKIELAGQVLRALRNGHAPEKIWLSLGGRLGFPQATLLLAVLCKQSRKLGHVFNSTPSRSSQKRREFLQTLRSREPEIPRPPQGQERSEQLSWQLGNLVSKLPQTGTPIAALSGFTGSPLARNVAGRVGRLRAYGNAINAEAARVWIETVMEAQP